MTQTIHNTPDLCQWIGNGTPANPLACTCTARATLRGYCTDHVWLVYKEGTAVHRKKDRLRYDQIRMWEGLFEQAVEELEAEGEIF